MAEIGGFISFFICKAETYQRLKPAVERERGMVNVSGWAALRLASASSRQSPVPGDIPWNRRHKKVRKIRPAEIVQRLVC